MVIRYDKGVSQRGIEYRREDFNFDVKNDTNIDLYRIVDRNDIFIGIKATKWNRSRNEYLKKVSLGLLMSISMII